MRVERPTQIAGVDGCKAGWIAVIVFPEAFEKAEVKMFARFAELISQLATRSVIAIDMPIGLPERTKKGGREADWAAREFLRPHQARIFPVPSRQAVYAYAKGFTEVSAIARKTSDPARAPSIQLFGILRPIQEIDAILRQYPALRDQIFEVHPEVSFKVMNSNEPLPSKKNERGMRLRQYLLNNEGFAKAFLDRPPPRGAGRDDFYDACACAWSARRILRGKARIFPRNPHLDGEGIEQAIRA